MAIFEKGKLSVYSEDSSVDLTKAEINKNLSAVAFDSDEKFFYMTVDKILFSDPASARKSVV